MTSEARATNNNNNIRVMIELLLSTRYYIEALPSGNEKNTKKKQSCVCMSLTA